jgi:hypothetical protein
VTDVMAKQDDGLTLLQEIRGDGLADGSVGAPTAGVDAPAGGVHMGGHIHTVPDIQSLVPDIQSLEKNSGVPLAENPDVVKDFDKE